MKSRWVTHKGIRIFLADYSSFTQNYEGLKKEIDYVTALIVKESPNSVLLLVDTRGTPGTPENVDLLKVSAVACKS